MSWQEELRRLDAALAEGTISLHDHRKLREELLAAAAGRWSPSPAASPLARPRRDNKAAGQTAPQAPHEPAFSASAQLLASSRPTTAPSPADERATERMPHPLITEAPTVVTDALGSLPGLTPPGRAAGIPPLPTVPVRKPHRKPTWLFVTVSVIVVLAMIVVAAFVLNRRDGNPASPTSAAPVAVNPADPVDTAEAKLPTLPGAANPASATMPLDKAVKLQVLTPADADLMEKAGATELIYRGSNDPGGTANGDTVLVVPTSSKAAAIQLTAGLRQGLTNSGFSMSPLGPAESDRSFTRSTSAGRVTALWYTSETFAIGIGVSQPRTGDPALLRSRLEQIRAQVTAALPAA